MPVPERPQLRPYLLATPADREGRNFILSDQLRVTDRLLRVTRLELEWLQLFDGQRTLRDVQLEAMRKVGGQLVPLEVVTRLAHQLDEALFLDGDRYRERANSPIRL